MGRRKIKIEALPESQIKAKFKKRKSGLVKKAYELGTLCGAQVALIIFSKDGEEVIDKGYNATTLEIIQRYWSEVLSGGDRSRHGRRQQQSRALQVQQLQPNSDSSTGGIPMDTNRDPNMHQDQHVHLQAAQDQCMNLQPQVPQNQFVNSQVPQDPFMNPQVPLDVYVNPQVPHDPFMSPQLPLDVYVNPQLQQTHQYMNPQAQQTDQYMSSQVQEDQYMSPHQQQDPYMSPQVQQDQCMNPHQQQGVLIDPRTQQDHYMNPLRQQEVPITGPCVQQDLYVNPHGQQSMTGISQMQPGMQYSRGTNFMDTSNFRQNMVEGNQQHVPRRHPTQFENQTNVRFK